MKHAYMIMAHNQIDLLKVLLNKLDTKENDIIVHLDKKSNIEESDLKDSLNEASLYFANRVSVTWGGKSNRGGTKSHEESAEYWLTLLLSSFDRSGFTIKANRVYKFFL